MVSKKLRAQIFEKYEGLCCYTGTPLEPDWQVDHLISRKFYKRWGHFMDTEVDDISNMVPCQRIINHYKRGLHLEEFRTDRMATLHKRLAKLPKNPRYMDGQRRKDYLLKVAELFGITKDKPFGGKFYFETLEDDCDK